MNSVLCACSHRVVSESCHGAIGRCRCVLHGLNNPVIKFAGSREGPDGRVRPFGISKRGDKYLRTLLIHGARAAIDQAKNPTPWMTRVTETCHKNVAGVALANKNARTIWALPAHDRNYERQDA